MEGIKKIRKFGSWVKKKKRFFLISYCSILVVCFGIIIFSSQNKFTKVSAAKMNGTNCEVTGNFFVGTNTNWLCENKNLVVKNETQNNPSNLFITGTHNFSSVTVESNAHMGTLDADVNGPNNINTNIGVKEYGYLQIPDNVNVTVPVTSLNIVPLDFPYYNGLKDIIPGGFNFKIKKIQNSDGSLINSWNNNNFKSFSYNVDLAQPIFLTGPKHKASGLYEIELQFKVPGDWSKINNFYNGFNWDWNKDNNYPVNQSLFYLSQTKNAKGLYADFTIWSNADKDFKNIAQTRILTNPAKIYNDANAKLKDPFIRSEDFAKLVLNVSGDVNNKGTINVVGGKNGGPYLASTYYKQGKLPDYEKDWLSNGWLEIHANNLTSNAGGKIIADASNGIKINNSVPQIDGGNGGIIILNASDNITLDNVSAKGGQGTYSGNTPGGGGSGGIIQISGNSSGDSSHLGITNINTSGGAGSDGSLGSNNGGRPGRSLFSYVETQFIGAPDPKWIAGESANGQLNTPTTNSGTFCDNVPIKNWQPQNGSSQWGGCGGRNFDLLGTSSFGIFSGSGGDGNTHGDISHDRETGGGGGGAGGIIILNINSFQFFGGDFNNFNANGGEGGWGGHGGEPIPLGGSPTFFDNPGNSTLDNFTKLKDFDFSLTSKDSSGQSGIFGQGGVGGGGAGGIINILHSFTPQPKPNQIQGDIHANGKITISANATGIVSSTGTVQYIISSLSKNLTKYTIDSNSDASWSEGIPDATASLNRLKAERAQPYSSLVTAGYNLSGGIFDKNPEGGVWWQKSGGLTIDCSKSYSGRGTIIVDGDVTINHCNSANLSMGIISENGNITVDSSTNNLNAALFAPHGNIIINGGSTQATFNGFFVAESIQINRSSISINYNSKLANPALPGFSEVLSPIWMQTTL